MHCNNATEQNYVSEEIIMKYFESEMGRCRYIYDWRYMLGSDL